MKKSVVGIIVFCLVGIIVLFLSNSTSPTEEMNYSPNIMIDGTLYWFATAYTDLDLPDDYVLIGTVQENISGVSYENFTASGVAVGSQIYQSEKHPGWLFIKWNQYFNLFTTWELGCALLQYNGSIYISVKDLQSNIEAESYSSIKVESFSKDYQYTGTLHMEEKFSFPCEEFGTNSARYGDGRLYFASDKPSTLYVEVGEGNTTWKEAFYQVSMIPLDINKYQ